MRGTNLREAVFAIFFVICKCGALENGLARTPPMGWLSWTRFMCQIDCHRYPKHCISENLFIDMAERLVKDGYRDAGYVHVNVDDCWLTKERDKHGRLQADPQRFSHGIKYLADYMHERGLKLGMYGNYGQRTCMGYPGSKDFMEIDARTFAEWGADMLKFDGCFSDPNTFDKGYPLMQKYLNETGRKIIYSCSWPYYVLTEAKKEPDYALISKHCNLWRNFDDIQINWNSILRIIDFYDANQDKLAPFHGPGHWNDPDMIIIGNPGLTTDQARVQMALWCIWSAPLLMSNDLRDIRPEFREILLNRISIQINQDPLGVMGKKIKEIDHISVYKKPILPVYRARNDFSYALAFFNRHVTAMKHISFKLNDFGLDFPNGYEAENVFNGSRLGRITAETPLTIAVPPTGVVMYRLVVFDPEDGVPIDVIKQSEGIGASWRASFFSDPKLFFACCIIFLVLFLLLSKRSRVKQYLFRRWKRL